MWDEYAKSIGTTANNLTQQQKIQAEVNGILTETRFQTGDAAKIANSYSGQILRLQYNFNNLKIAIGNLITPMVQAVLPTINSIIEGLTKIANIAAKIMYDVFGLQASSAAETITDVANAQGDLADSTNEAAAAAKKALAGFDELNRLSDSSSTTASAGTGTTATTETSVEGPPPAEVELPPWAGKLKDFFQKIKDLSEGSFGENIVAFFKGFWDALKPVVKAILDAVVWALDAIISLVSDSNPNTMEKVGYAIGIIAGALLLFAAGTAIAGIVSEIGASIGILLKTLAAHPLIAMAAGLTALYFASKSFMDYMYEQSDTAQFIENLDAALSKIQEVNDEATEFINGLSDNRTDINNQYGAIETLADKYFDLADQETLAADKVLLLKSYAEELVDYIPELNGKIDLNTGAYTGTKNEIMKLIDKTKEYYLVQAAQDSLVEIAKHMYAGQTSLTTAEIEQKKAQAEYNKEFAKYIKMIKTHKTTTYKSVEAVGEAVGAINQQKKEVDELKSALDKANTTLIDTQATQKKLNDEWDYATSYITKYSDTTSTSNEKVKGSFSDTEEKVGQSVKEMADESSTATQRVLGSNEVLAEKTGSVLSGIFGAISSSLGSIVKSASGAVSDVDKEFSDDTKTEKAAQGLVARIAKAFSAIPEAARNSINSVSTSFSSDTSAKTAAQSWWDKIIGVITSPKTIGLGVSIAAAGAAVGVPKYATGTVIPPNAAHLAVVGDNRYERELISPESLIRKIVREEAGSGGGGEITINLTNEIDGEVVTRKVIKIHNGLVRQTGASPLLV